MKKNFLGFGAIVLAISLASFTTSKVNERYWYASDDTTYTGNFEIIADEISDLESAQPLYDFFDTQVSGSTAYEFGYNVQSPAGSPVETIYRKLH